MEDANFPWKWAALIPLLQQMLVDGSTGVSFHEGGMKTENIPGVGLESQGLTVQPRAQLKPVQGGPAPAGFQQ